MKHSIFFCFFLFSIGLSAQSLIDSLSARVITMPEDSHKVLTYRLLYRALYQKDKTQEMLDIAEKGLILSRQLSYLKGIDLFLFYKASALDMLGRGQESISLYEEGFRLAQQKGDRASMGDYQINIGTAWYGLGKLDQALPAFLDAYRIFQALEEPQKLSKILNNIGVIYRKQGKYDRAEEIYHQSLAIKEQLKDTLGIAACWQNFGGIYSTTDRPSEAIEAQKKALVIYEKFQKRDDMVGTYNLLANIYYNIGKRPEAKNELNRAVAIESKYPVVAHRASTYQLLGFIAADEGNHPLAVQYLQTGLESAQKYGQNGIVYDILVKLHQSENALGNYSAAYQHLKTAFSIRDTATQQARLALMEEMQTRFDVVQKDNTIKINQLELKERTTQRNTLLLGFGAFTILALAIFFGLRSRIKANQRIAAQEMALQKQDMVHREQQYQLDVLRAMLEGQEQERSRIAADLHDGLGGLLTSIKSHFNSINLPDDGLPSLAEKTNELIDESCGEVRRIAHNMMPRALAVAGLAGALEDLSNDLRQKGITCELEMVGMEQSFVPEKALMVFRIIQELANNVVKHAAANHLLLQLIRKGNTLTIIAEDDGKGFDVTKALQHKGLGLSNIESRVKFLHGEMNWDSELGIGTTVSILIPL